MASEDEETRTNLIINYLPQTMTDSELTAMFITVGPIKSTRIMRDSQNGYSYGYGFVEYHKPEDAAKAITTLNGLHIMNKRIKVAFARKPGEDIKDTNLYISHLPRDVTEEKIEEWFGHFGTIVQYNVLKDKNTGMPRGVAFVRYEKRSQALEAIKHMHNCIPPGGTDSLTVKIAQEHGKQKAAYYAGLQAGMSENMRTSPAPVSGNRTFSQAMRAMATTRQVWQQGFPPGPTGSFNDYSGTARFSNGNPGAMRNDRVGNRYNPIGMGGGYSNMYNWN